MEPAVHSGERSVAYPELFGRAARVARGYDSLGVATGDSVALLLRNDIAFLEASLGCAVLGATPVPINWHWQAGEVAYLLRDSGAKALVVHDDLWPAVADALPEGVEVIGVAPPPEVRAAYRLDGADGPPRRYEEWLTSSEPWDRPPDSSPQSIIYTSGTTGRPKGVVRRAQREEDAEAARAIIERIFGLRDGARTVIPAPLYHTAPNVYALSCAVRMIDMTLMPRLHAEELLRIIDARRVTTVQVVPTMFVRLLQLPEAVRARYDTSSLETVVHAAAPCPPAVKQAMIDWLGPIVDEYYGSTETGPVVFCTSEEWLAHPGTVGRALDGGVVKVLDAEGRELPPGESGEVYLRLGAFPDFTYHGDDAKRAAVERDGLVTAGDV